MDRAIHDILTEWRAAERELEDAVDDDAREVLAARVAALASQHDEAVRARTAEAVEVGTSDVA